MLNRKSFEAQLKKTVISNEIFVEEWMKGVKNGWSRKQVAENLGYASEVAAYSRAKYLRKLGVKLPELAKRGRPKPNVPALNKLIRQLM